MQQLKKVLIVGGGIGGLTAAIALKQQGIDSEIVEIDPAWSVYGVAQARNPRAAGNHSRSIGRGTGRR